MLGALSRTNTGSAPRQLTSTSALPNGSGLRKPCSMEFPPVWRDTGDIGLGRLRSGVASTRLTPLRGELPGYRRRRDVAPLAPRPSAPTALFAFTYLEMTRGVAHEFALFDNARFASGTSMHSTTGTPTAWQIAFATADRQQPSVALDPILGMSAHVNRDLAYIAPALAAGDPNL